MRAQVNLLYNSTPPTKWQRIIKSVTQWLSADIISSKAITDAVQGVFDRTINDGDIPPGIYEDTYRHLALAIDKGFGKVAFGHPDYDFVQQLKHNTAVFSAFKNHAQTKEMVAQLTDDEGKPRSFQEFRKATASISKNYNERWLETEHKLATRQARSARDWKDAERTADLYPNLEYMPSHAADPRDAHRKFYRKILPIDDPFWDTYMPPSDWGCKCSVRKTDKEPTDIDTTNDTKPPAQGIAHNTGKSAQIFAPSHPQIKNTSKAEKKKIKEQADDLETKNIRNNAYNYARKNLQGKSFKNKFFENPIQITRKGIEKFLNQPSDNLYNQKNALLLSTNSIKEAIKQAKLIETVPYKEDKKASRTFKFMHYCQITLKNENAYFNIREDYNKNLFLYSLTDKIKNET